MPRVSVIVPSFNAALWLRDAVASVRAQDFSDWELVIVDDASSDAASRELALSFQGKNVRVIVHEQNSGVAAARNTAIKAALGEIIVPLDPDDELPQGALSAAESVFDEQKCDFVFGPQEQVDWLSGASRTVDPGKYARAGQAEGQPWHGCMPFRKSLWEKLGGYDEWRGYAGLDDWHFWLRAEAAGSRGGYCAATLYRYRMRPGSISNECRPEWLEASLRTFRDVPTSVLKPALRRKIVVARARQAATYWRKRGKPATAAGFALRGLRHVPWSMALWKTLAGCIAETVLPPLRQRYMKLLKQDEQGRAELEARLRAGQTP
jgi:glycosyltransferase involved in cell wall biosynthesis